MREAQEIAEPHVLPWLQAEQEEGEKEDRRIATRFIHAREARAAGAAAVQAALARLDRLEREVLELST